MEEKMIIPEEYKDLEIKACGFMDVRKKIRKVKKNSIVGVF